MEMRLSSTESQAHLQEEAPTLVRTVVPPAETRCISALIGQKGAWETAFAVTGIEQALDLRAANAGSRDMVLGASEW